jgi:hypothetical protein
MSYELWDTDTGNLIRSYPTSEEALALVCTAVSAHGKCYVSRWTLIAVHANGESQTIAQGAALAARAAKLVPAQTRGRRWPSK